MKPLLKWVGGKGALLDEILPVVLDGMGSSYVEPFVGGGAVAFAVAARRPDVGIRIADANRELINFYRCVADGSIAQPLTAEMRSMWGNRAWYNDVRADFNAGIAGPITGCSNQAARFYYLNKHGFNGLYRVNRAGLFNVPKGSGPVAPIAWGAFDEAAPLLSTWKIAAGNYNLLCDYATTPHIDIPPGSTIYMDPPYVGTFGGYTNKSAEPYPLLCAKIAEEQRARGCRVLMSNSPAAEALIPNGMKPTWVRQIGSRANSVSAGKRIKIPEILYGWEPA